MIHLKMTIPRKHSQQVIIKTRILRKNWILLSHFYNFFTLVYIQGTHTICMNANITASERKNDTNRQYKLSSRDYTN